MAYNSSTNLSLRSPIDQHSIESDVDNLQSAHNANMAILELALGGAATIATNATVVDTAGERIVNLYTCSAGSIATITGMLTNVPFTLVQRSSGASFGVCDASPFLLNSTDYLTKCGSNITLVWNGTNYIELGRVDP